jgi:phosphonate ABC transporter permease subunit PhnE
MANKASSRSQAALWRLLIVLSVAAVLVVFSYGWWVTDIDLSVPQQPQRQENVGNALRELLSPNVFTQEYDIHDTTTAFTIECPDGFTPPEQVASDTEPYIVVTPACAGANEVVTVQGYNFAPDSLARINWIGTDEEPRIRQPIGSTDNNFVTDGSGSFSVQIEVPRIRGSAGERHTIQAQGAVPVGSPTFSETTGTVLEKMIETIALAAIATAVSVLPSAVLSFFAAHNLMRAVRIPLGNLLVSVVLLPIGLLIGAVLLGRLGMLAFNLASGSGAAVALTVGFASVASAQKLRTSVEPPNGAMRSIVSALLIALVTIIALGILGGLGALFARVYHETIQPNASSLPGTIGVVLRFFADAFGYVATFIGSIAELIELLLIPLGAVIGGFTLSSIGGSLTKDMLKHVSIPVSHILGGVLGVISGAIVLGAMAAIGTVAAWLGLLTPIVAAGLASPLLPQLYRRFFVQKDVIGRGERAIMSVLSWVGALAAFAFTFSTLNVGRALIEGTLPPQIPAFTLGEVTVSQYLWRAMLIGAVLGGVGGLLAGTKANFPIGNTLYTVTRTILNALRSIEPLIMGIVFVIWVGIGPFAGVLALALHSIASLGKLYSEQIESIDAGPIEALQSTGANRLQTIMYAVLPQVIPPYIAFTLYRWDINVRMSTIIGFVGGGGIGFLLQQQINLLRYRDAGVAVLAIAIVVSILDYASAAIRERYT